MRKNQAGQAFVETCIAIIVVPTFVVGIFSTMLGLGLNIVGKYLLHEAILCRSSIVKERNCLAEANQKLRPLKLLISFHHFEIRNRGQRIEGTLTIKPKLGAPLELREEKL